MPPWEHSRKPYWGTRFDRPSLSLKRIVIVPPRISAGLLIYRLSPNQSLEVLLGHYGGPFWSRVDQGGWTVFKGAAHNGETLHETATREFEEETGWPAPPAPWLPLPQVKTSHQVMNIWAVEADFDSAALAPGLFSMEWPPRSGKTQEFPEIDRAEWFSITEARAKMSSGQIVLLDHLICLLQ